MPVVKDEISLVKVANGDDGRGILGTPVATYAQSTSGTIPPTTWSATRPNVPAGQYLWTRVVTTYTDNTTSETQTPTLMGAEGESGLGIKDKSISYAVGTSGNTPPTIGWQETIPTVSANQYLWTKTTLVYTDDTKTDAYSVGKMGADGANAKLLFLTASAENMVFNADDTPKTTQTINIVAKLQNVTGTATFTAVPYIGNAAQTAITLGGTGNTRTLTSAQWTNKDWTLIAITATLDNLSDTLSIVKVKDGKEGETYFPHPAWMMADGTFTKVYPNENELPNSKSPVFLNYLGSTVTTEIVSVSEWGATDAVKHTVSGGTNATIAGVLRSGTTVGANNPYVHSIYVKNTGTSYVRLNNNLGQAIDVYPGETKRVVFNSRSSAAGTASKQFVLYRLDATVTQEFIVWHAKIEKSQDTATIWTPPPDEDYGNAYPKYEGFYSDTNEVGSDDPDDYKPWTPFMGPKGPEGDKGDSAPLISLSGATQAITVDKDGKITPATSFTVTGTAVNTTISNWTYSLNGGNFGSALPAGVTRSGNTVTINPTTATFDQLTIRAADATVSDVYTISRIKDGGDGVPGSDAYTVFLTNESYTFAGSTSAALAGSTTTEVVVYKGINKITPTNISIGEQPAGLSSSVGGSTITFTASTALVTKSGTVSITITVDGKTFTKQFAYAISFQGGKGDPGENGVSVTGTQVQYVQSSSMTEPTTGWSNIRPTPVPGQWLWTRSRSIFSDGTYGLWATVPTLIGREAIVISATAPSDPSTGTLWQTPTDPNVKQWNGANWIDWGISVENIIVENAVIKDGKFESIEGTTIKGSKIINSSTITIDGNEMDYTTTLEGSYESEWKLKASDLNGRMIINPTILASSAWNDIPKNEPAWAWSVSNAGIYTARVGTRSNTSLSNNASYGPDGITMASELYASTYGNVYLSYLDLLTINPTLLNPAANFETYSNAWIPTAKRTVGRVITLSGAFKNNVILPSADETVMGYVPEWAYPTQDINFRVNGSGINTFLLKIKSNGEITASRYGTTSIIDVPSGAWLNLSCVYSAK